MSELRKAAANALEFLLSGGNFVYPTSLRTDLEAALAEPEQSEPIAFQIYKPTPPRFAIPSVIDAELPWVYDQDPASGNVASMWVTPVKRKAPPRREPLTDDGRALLMMECLGPHALTGGKMTIFEAFNIAVDAVEKAHGIGVKS